MQELLGRQERERQEQLERHQRERLDERKRERERKQLEEKHRQEREQLNPTSDGVVNQGYQHEEAETSFIDSASTSQHDTSYTNKYIRHTRIKELAEFISEKYGQRGLYLGEDDAIEYNKFLLHVDLSNQGNITYDLGKSGRRIAKQVVLKRNASGVLEFNSAKSAKYAVDKFKTTLEEFVDTSKRRETVRELEASRVLIDTTPKTSPRKGLTEQENRELEGVLNPSDTMDPKSRFGNDGALQKQADHFQSTLIRTVYERDNLEDGGDSIFTKWYEANFTEEVFKISKVIRGDPNVYEIEDHEGESIIGKFYKEELSGVNKREDVYRVEKILKRKKVKGKKMALVKWLGYDSKHNSWIPESDIQTL